MYILFGKPCEYLSTCLYACIPNLLLLIQVVAIPALLQTSSAITCKTQS